MSVWMPSELGICARVPRLSRNLFTSGGDNLGTVCVPNRNSIHRAGIARTQQSLSVYVIGLHKHRRAGLIEHEGFGRFGDAVPEADAQRAIDAHPQVADAAFLEIAHIPSKPSSARAVSMRAGVISVMPRSLA